MNLILSILILMPISTAISQTTPSDLIKTFVGEWEGDATAYFPRDTDRAPRRESVKVTATQILKDMYVQCHARWTQTDGRSRELLIFWNHDASKDSVYILFLYDDWHGKVLYPLAYDAEERLFSGTAEFTAPGGIPAVERVSWRISKDGNEIYGTEHNNYKTDPPDYWPKTFEFVWRRK